MSVPAPSGPTPPIHIPSIVSLCVRSLLNKEPRTLNRALRLLSISLKDASSSGSQRSWMSAFMDLAFSSAASASLALDLAEPMRLLASLDEETMKKKASAGDVDMKDSTDADAKTKTPADEKQTDEAAAATQKPSAAALNLATPELTLTLYVATAMLLVDAHKYAEALKTCETAVQMAATYNRRTLDLLGARLFRLWGLAAEKSGGTKGLAALRPQMLAYHRTSCVRHDIPGQEVLLNLLLRSYLSERLYAQAERLRSRAPLPEGALGARSNAQQARYLHYLGRIRAVHLEYTEAKECLSQALRKAPARAAAGFRMLTTKWLVVVRMLLGETPERRELTGVKVLAPYFALAAAAREGSLAAFTRVVESHGAVFARDGLSHLVARLRRNVIRSGVRRVALAYTRISLADVASKIGLEGSSSDVASVVAKVIRDGGEGMEEAYIDHASGCLCSRGAPNVYGTRSPAAQFHDRTMFLMDVHNEALRAMRFPAKAGDDGETEEQRRERRLAESELATAIAEEDDDDFL